MPSPAPHTGMLNGLQVKPQSDPHASHPVHCNMASFFFHLSSTVPYSSWLSSQCPYQKGKAIICPLCNIKLTRNVKAKAHLFAHEALEQLPQGFWKQWCVTSAYKEWRWNDARRMLVFAGVTTVLSIQFKKLIWNTMWPDIIPHQFLVQGLQVPKPQSRPSRPTNFVPSSPVSLTPKLYIRTRPTSLRVIQCWDLSPNIRA